MIKLVKFWGGYVLKIFKNGFHGIYSLERLFAEQYGQSKLSFFAFMLLRVIVVIALVVALINGRYENVMLCVLTLILFMIPAFLERKLNADFPTYFEVALLIFIFSAEILGEICAFYVKFAFWDTMLHGISGFLLTACGFSFIDLFHKDDNLKFKLHPVYMTFSSFSFATTFAVLWEFFECGMDTFFGKDMQKDTIVKSFQSVVLDPTNSNIPIKVKDIQQVVIDGKPLPFEGYLDIGLLDTMKDLAIASFGSIIFCILAYIYLKSKGKNKFVSLFIPVKRNWTENPPDVEAPLATKILEIDDVIEERIEERKEEREADKANEANHQKNENEKSDKEIDTDPKKEV